MKNLNRLLNTLDFLALLPLFIALVVGVMGIPGNSTSDQSLLLEETFRTLLSCAGLYIFAGIVSLILGARHKATNIFTYIHLIFFIITTIVAVGSFVNLVGNLY